tara:strand:+ start:28 stop:393 length:366 start_codon:yes stop_codon:yes gene_type:complete
MSKTDNLDKVAAIEKAISKKYGKKTIQNPKSRWNDEKEAEYLEQQKKIAEKIKAQSESDDRVEQDGVFVSKKLLNREKTNRICSICEIYSFDMRDDLYMNKFDSCFECYIKFIEGREYKNE